jgi:hypothetical protein
VPVDTTDPAMIERLARLTRLQESMGRAAGTQYERRRQVVEVLNAQGHTAHIGHRQHDSTPLPPPKPWKKRAARHIAVSIMQ